MGTRQRLPNRRDLNGTSAPAPGHAAHMMQHLLDHELTAALMRLWRTPVSARHQRTARQQITLAARVRIRLAQPCAHLKHVNESGQAVREPWRRTDVPSPSHQQSSEASNLAKSAPRSLLPRQLFNRGCDLVHALARTSVGSPPGSGLRAAGRSHCHRSCQPECARATALESALAGLLLSIGTCTRHPSHAAVTMARRGDAYKHGSGSGDHVSPTSNARRCSTSHI
jgi:hypothetical protein